MQFAQEDAERKRLNERLQARKQDFRTGKAEQDLSGLIQTRKPFTWEALTYDVSVPGGTKRLLNEIYGYVKPGTLTALMGSSGLISLIIKLANQFLIHYFVGAGKTTLLDVLANRKTTVSAPRLRFIFFDSSIVCFTVLGRHFGRN